jgi:hypothetical protein
MPVFHRLSAGLLTLLLVPLGTAAAAQKNGFDLSDSLVAADEIHLGGPPRDGIPALDRPRFVAAEEGGFLEADDRVLGLQLNGHARAYPIAILNWHEVVNDVLGGEPVAITYCPLCGTGIAFDARVGGRTLEFGVSGLLYNSDVLLYDRQTESLWSQIRMQAISGPLKGVHLKPLPLRHTSWQAWRAAQPQTVVLSTDTGFARDYRRDPYAGYQEEATLYFPVAQRSHRYHPKERVLGLEVDGRYKAYPFAELARAGRQRIADRLADREIEIRFDAASQSAEAFDADGRPLPAVTSFWFAWYAFHPDTEVFTTAR